MHNKQIGFQELVTKISSINDVSVSSKNFKQRMDLWNDVNTDIADILQEHKHRQTKRNEINTVKTKELKEDLDVYNDMLDESNNKKSELEEKLDGPDDKDNLAKELTDTNKNISEIYKDMKEIKTMLHQFNKEDIPIDELEEKIFKKLEYLVQKEKETPLLEELRDLLAKDLTQVLILPKLSYHDILEIYSLSPENRTSEHKLKNGMTLGTILSVCKLSENDLVNDNNTGTYHRLIKCRIIAKTISSKKDFQIFMQKTIDTAPRYMHSLYNEFVHGRKAI